MHNSLFIRELLARTNNDPLRIDRRNAHRNITADPSSTTQTGEFALDGEWCVRCDSNVGEAWKLAAADFDEFLALMNVVRDPDATNVIVLGHDAMLPPRAYRLTKSPTKIEVFASDAAGIWAGVAALEREMRFHRGPILAEGTVERTARWRWQVSQGPWGGNYSVPDFSPEYLSDDAFKLYAHYGVNSMMIYGDLLCYVQSDILPELNHPDYDHHIAMLADAAKRAARFGVQFTYVVVGPKLRSTHPVFQTHPSTRGSGVSSPTGDYSIHCLCSSDETIAAFYDETFTKLFRAVPELAGMYFIIATESFYHCRMWRNPTYRCPRCYEQVQEDVVGSMLGRIADAVQRVKSDAFVLGWPYNTDPWDRPDGYEFVRRLPKNVGLFNQIDRKHWYEKDGYRKLIWDYSIDYIGPATQVVDRIKIAKERGLTLFTKTETGIGLEVFQFPYVPALNRLADKWQVMRDLKPDGVHQSWLFFGMFGSRAEELAHWAAYEQCSRDEYLRTMATRDFGPEATDSVVAAWTAMSEAVGHIPSITLAGYYVGPSFLGPCHPLIPDDSTPVPDEFDAVLFFLQEGEETFSRRRNEIRSSLVMEKLQDSARSISIEWDGDGDGWDIVLREYRSAADHARASWKHLRDATPHTQTETDAKNLLEETLLTELVYRTFVSCANTVEFLMQRARFEASRDSDARNRMREIARDELENALAAQPIYDQCPWLDIAERTDGYFTPCRVMIEKKAEMLRAFLSEKE